MRSLSSLSSILPLALTLSLPLAPATTGCAGPSGESADQTGQEGQAGEGDGAPGGGDTIDSGGAAADDGGGTGDATVADVSDRDRIIASYLDFLKENPDVTQSNGLRGADLVDVCDLWNRLDPSSQATFLTVTARMEGSILGADQSTMLDHITAAYRIVGGEGASGTDPGSCGGGEANRMIMSMDQQLHDALLAASVNQGDDGASGSPDIADIPDGGVWRDSHDVGGTHEPFDLSDETDDGAPRGQVQYFSDPASALATSPLGRQDLADLVDPFAIEMDQDYDCAHNSNPSCEYTFYGALCFPQSTELGVDIYTDNYGSIQPDWRPTGC